MLMVCTGPIAAAVPVRLPAGGATTMTKTTKTA
jgi:hypothetical protein